MFHGTLNTSGHVVSCEGALPLATSDIACSDGCGDELGQVVEMMGENEIVETEELG